MLEKIFSCRVWVLERYNVNNLTKIIYTLKNFRKTAYHHYGKNYFSFFKIIYYSLLHLNKFVLFEKTLDDSIVPANLGPEYKVIKPTLEQLKKIRGDKELPREFYYDKFHGIKKCYLLIHGEQPAGISWVYMKGDPNRFLKLEEGVGEVNYLTILPKFQGQKLMIKMLLYILNDMKNNGLRKAVSVVNIINPPALKSMIESGFKEVTIIKTIGHFNKKYHIL